MSKRLNHIPRPDTRTKNQAQTLPHPQAQAQPTLRPSPPRPQGVCCRRVVVADVVVAVRGCCARGCRCVCRCAMAPARYGRVVLPQKHRSKTRETTDSPHSLSSASASLPPTSHPPLSAVAVASVVGTFRIPSGQIATCDPLNSTIFLFIHFMKNLSGERRRPSR